MQALSEDLTLMLVQGKHPNELKKDFAKKFKAKAFEAYRLLHTESSFLTNRAALDDYKEDDIEEYEILGTLDSKTCATCGEKDGKRVKIRAI